MVSLDQITRREYIVENNNFTEMCSESEAGSYSRLTDFVQHSTLGLSVLKKKKIRCGKNLGHLSCARSFPRTRKLLAGQRQPNTSPPRKNCTFL